MSWTTKELTRKQREGTLRNTDYFEMFITVTASNSESSKEVMRRKCQTPSSSSASNFSCSQQEPLSLTHQSAQFWNLFPTFLLWCFLWTCKWTQTGRFKVQPLTLCITFWQRMYLAKNESFFFSFACSASYIKLFSHKMRLFEIF